MKILHIASVKNNPFNGVCVAVPQHIRYQGEIAEVALLNICNCLIDNIDNQHYYQSHNWETDLFPRAGKPDIVVFHEVYHSEFIKIAKMLVDEGIPYVIVPHGCLVKEAQHKKRFKKLLANYLLFHKFIYGCSGLQCLSNNELNNTVFSVKKFIGTNGVTIPEICKTTFNEDKLRIVYIGRLEIIPKGLDMLIQAIKRVKEDSECFRHIGSIDLFGPDYKGRFAAVQSLISQCGVGDIVTLHHELMGDEKIKCLMNADVFIQTSRHEGMPMGILEAMSYGIPCIITDGTSLGEITKSYDAGWVSECSVDSIEKTIRRAINEKHLLPQKSINGRTLVVNHFSWKTIAKSTVDKYASLINQ